MRRLTLVAVLLVAVAVPAAPASGTVTATRSAKKVARAIVAKPGVLRGARFVKLPPQGNPAAVSTTKFNGFSRNRGAFGVLSTGDATLLDDPNEQDDLSTDNAGAPYRGAAVDAVVLRLDLRAPARANCLRFAFKLFSEEYDEFVDTEFNDVFTAEVRRLRWRSDPADSRTKRRKNTLRGVPITVSGTGRRQTAIAPAAGTTYDGATRSLRASRRVRPGRRTRLFLSIFDQGDHQYDTTVALDRLTIDRRKRCR
jgi:hypothetical protein